MHTHNTQQDLIQSNASRPFGHSLLIILGVVMVLLTGFFWWKKSSIASEIETLQESIAKKEEQILTLSGGTGVDARKNSADIVRRAQAYRTEWSQVMSDILSFELSGIQFKNIGVGSDKNVSISADANRMDTFLSLMSYLKKSPMVKDLFVSGFTKSSGSGGSDSLSFSMKFVLIPSTETR